MSISVKDIETGKECTMENRSMTQSFSSQEINQLIENLGCLSISQFKNQDQFRDAIKDILSCWFYDDDDEEDPEENLDPLLSTPEFMRL